MLGREREINVARHNGHIGSAAVLVLTIGDTIAVGIVTDKQTVKFKAA